MSRVSRFGQRRCVIGPVLLLLATLACSRPTPAVPTEGASQPTQTPLQKQENGSLNGSEPAALIEKATPDPILPFQSSHGLPAGSLLTVRLKSPIAATEKAEGTGAFEAVIDEPAVFEGRTLVPRGTIALGRVGAAHVSNVRPDRGYVQLSLESVNLDGFRLPLQTAVLFARQIPSNVSSGTIRLEEGRRLTFRLTEPFYPDVKHAQPSR